MCQIDGTPRLTLQGNKLRLTEDEMGQAVGNMFSVVVAAQLLCGLLPSAVTYHGDITEAIWEIAPNGGTG